MIDLHSHVLPGVDDGAPDWESAVAMMQMAAEGGTELLVATPHAPNDGFGYGVEALVIPPLVAEANLRAQQAGLALRVVAGHECYADMGLVERLQAGTLLTLGGSQTVLLELPFTQWPPFTDSLIFELQVAGYTVLLAHPERYRAVAEEPNRLLPLVERGVLTQVSSTSIEGRSGPKVRELAQQLLAADLAHVVASDAHTTGGRHPNLRATFEAVVGWFDEATAQRLFVQTPRALLADEPVIPSNPTEVIPLRRKRFGIF